MITIITEITDLKIFKNYWLPLVCRHRDVNFIFGNIEKNNLLVDWSNVEFIKKDVYSRENILRAKTEIIYITKQNEIPTYELMVKFRNPVEGIIPKIHNTNDDSSSFSISKNIYGGIQLYPNFKRSSIDVTTYLI